MKKYFISLTTLAALATSSLVAAQSAAPNPFARPTAAPTAPAPATPGALPAIPPPGLAPAGAPLLGGPGVELSDVAEPAEEVPATRIGTVNGQVIYRGNGTYLFEKAGKTPVARKPVASTTPIPGTLPLTMPSPTTGLPSLVGRPSSNK